MWVRMVENENILSRILNEPTKLSEKQKEAVVSNSRYLKVIAGAGAGKTETLTRRIAYLLLVEEVEPASIVAFTFTEKAAQSMKSRIYQRISQLGREDLLKRLGEMYVGTIHSFCLRLLEDHFGYGDYQVFDENQEMSFILRQGWTLGLGKQGYYSKNCEEFLNTISVVYGELIDRELIKQKAPEFNHMLFKFEEELDRRHRFTFNRIIHETIEQLRKNLEDVSYIQHLIVDEFQDINEAQFQLIKLLGQNGKIFVVGDPRQSIYQWRGSNEKYFHDFSDEFEDASTVEIKENRRSAKEIVGISNLFADGFSDVDYEHLIPTRDQEGEAVKLEFEKPEEEARWVAEEIQRLTSQGDCSFKDFGILMRSVKTSAEPFLAIFKEKKIPYIVGGKVGLFKRDEAQAIARIIAWVSPEGFWIPDPYNWKEKIIEDELLETGLDLWQTVTEFNLPSTIKQDLKKWKDEINNGKYSNFKDLYHSLLCKLGYLNFNPEDKLHVALMANLGRFSSLLGDFETTGRFGGRRVNVAKEIKSLCWYMNNYASKAYEEQPADDIRKIDAVQILTVHQAKGLEWPIVIVPSLLTNRFPSIMAGRQRRWYIPRELFNAERYEGGIEEEKRLFYVAISRPRDQLILSYFKARRQSEFLDTIDKIGVKLEDAQTYTIKYKSPEKVKDEEIQTFSATEIIDYMRCPHHYRLLKLWGYIQNPSPLIGYGETLHFCLRYAAELIKHEGYNPISAVATAVDEKFFLPFSSEKQAEKIKKSAKKLLIQFAKDREKDMKNIEEVESRIEFPVQNATIVGKVDVILKEGNVYEIRDYKTSDEVLSKEDSQLQVKLYSQGLRNMGWDIQQGSVAYLKESQLDTVNVAEEKVNEARKIAESTINNIVQGRYQPKPSKFCVNCEYSDICKWVKNAK